MPLFSNTLFEKHLIQSYNFIVRSWMIRFKIKISPHVLLMCMFMFVRGANTFVDALYYITRSACTISSFSNGETGSRAPLHLHHAPPFMRVLSGSAGSRAQHQQHTVRIIPVSLQQSHTHTHARARVHKLRTIYRPSCTRTHTHTHVRAPPSKACRIHACTKQHARAGIDKAQELFHVR